MQVRVLWLLIGLFLLFDHSLFWKKRFTGTNMIEILNLLVVKLAWMHLRLNCFQTKMSKYAARNAVINSTEESICSMNHWARRDTKWHFIATHFCAGRCETMVEFIYYLNWRSQFQLIQLLLKMFASLHAMIPINSNEPKYVASLSVSCLPFSVRSQSVINFN